MLVLHTGSLSEQPGGDESRAVQSASIAPRELRSNVVHECYGIHTTIDDVFRIHDGNMRALLVFPWYCLCPSIISGSLFTAGSSSEVTRALSCPASGEDLVAAKIETTHAVVTGAALK